MIRTFCLVACTCLLAQNLPAGCPGASNDNTTPAERGEITTEAVSPGAAQVGDLVELVATATADAEGGAIRYAWVQVSGPGVAIENSTSRRASFVAPSLASEQALGLLVTTSNERGDVGRAEVRVTVVADPNFGQSDGGTGGGGTTSRPVRANAGDDQTVNEGDTVRLDGSSSRGTELVYLWRQTLGTEVALSDAAAARPTFAAPAFVEGGENSLRFTLQVTDVRNRTSTDTVVVTVVPDSVDPDRPRVEIQTSMGNMVVELNRTRAPITVDNFLQYVDDEFYDGTLFHRVIAGFVIQGGGFLPGLVQKPVRDPIVSEADNGLRNQRGTIAMARTSDPDSATAQFYINLVDNEELDASGGSAGYTVFGEVVEGLSIADQIATVPTDVSDGFEDVPVTDVIIRSIRRVVP